MFNVGGGEILVIMLIALIVLGPQRLPDAARQIGKAMGDLRRLSTGFQNEVRSALDTADDPNRVAARRNVLAKEAPVDGGDAPASNGSGVANAPSGPPKVRPPSAQARAAAKKQAGKPTAKTPASRSATAKQPAAKNGTPVKKTTKKAAKKATTAKKTPAKAVSKAAPRRTRS